MAYVQLHALDEIEQGVIAHARVCGRQLGRRFADDVIEPRLRLAVVRRGQPQQFRVRRGRVNRQSARLFRRHVPAALLRIPV